MEVVGLEPTTSRFTGDNRFPPARASSDKEVKTEFKRSNQLSYTSRFPIWDCLWKRQDSNLRPGELQSITVLLRPASHLAGKKRRRKIPALPTELRSHLFGFIFFQRGWSDSNQICQITLLQRPGSQALRQRAQNGKLPPHCALDTQQFGPPASTESDKDCHRKLLGCISHIATPCKK